ncbi:hypothetical protein [Chryseobacterium vaccae]|uniref:hypothetical protein n=1 Tax=Chryseobacterium vaccae TaxID=2604424 RepID=UPI001294A859|nr:hypothetical protein [Chryseobacterium vaccae]
MSKKLILLFTLNVFMGLSAQDKAELAIQTLEEKYPQEKIHLLLNKSSYLAGDHIWFKSFVFDGYTPSDISTNLFVELYDRNKVLIDKKLVPLFDGQGNGSFTLPESMKEDVYYMRAYTTWMTNFSEGFQLVKEIPVYNPASPEKLELNINSPWTASVYPESGTFINGINTKLAVRIQSKGAMPSSWNGYVVDTAKPDEKIASFKGFDENVGSFRMTPQSGKTYKLFVEDAKGNQQSINLPAVSSSGINLQVESRTDGIKYSLKSKNIANPSTFYKVIGTINNQLVFKSVINTLSDEKVYTIPAGQLVNGILQIIVIDDKDAVITQRLCFVKPDQLKVKQPTLSSSLNEAPRALNSFKINTDNSVSHYTVAVADGRFQSTEDDNSLLSTLWLTGDITSKLSSPYQYFTKGHNSDALDAVLISEKWKRFDWKSVMAGDFPIIRNNPEQYISYKGKVSVLGKPAPNATLNLIFNTEKQSMGLYPVKTDANGFFTLGGLIFHDLFKFHYQLNGENKETKVPKEQVQVIFQPNYNFVPYRSSLPESRYILTKRLPNDPLPEEITRSITTKSNQKLINEKIINIQEVKLRAQKKDLTKKLNDELSSPLFRSSNETVFDFVNDEGKAQGHTNVMQWLQGRVAGLQIQQREGAFVPLIRGAQPMIYLDEMIISPEQISFLSMSDVAMVKIIKDYFMGGFGGGSGGAILIYTKRGGSQGKIPTSEMFTQLKQVSLRGYDKPELFNNLDYSGGAFNRIQQDSRSTLYWNPAFDVDSSDDSSIKFYNNDDAKNYRIIIMGFDKESNLPLYYNEIVK